MITHDDIAAAKLQGNANNDWVLTHRLIENCPNLDGKPAPSYEDVKETFESLYQGHLYKSERLLVNRDIFENLKAKGYRVTAFGVYNSLNPNVRIHLGIVTGRPRKDAFRFLDEHHLTSFFESIVCMEDTPRLKPAPDPILLCLKQVNDTAFHCSKSYFTFDKMGVTEAAMIGDTVDDVRASVAAGVIAFGVVAPGSNNPGSHERNERKKRIISKKWRKLEKS